MDALHPRDRGRLSSGLWLAMIAVALTASCARDEPAPTIGGDLNVLVITLDTIRADRLGAYGNRDIRTHFVDEMAERGVVFDRCIAPTPLTLPSHTSLFTGTYPIFHGVRDNGNYVAPSELTTMAELFDDAGYRTGAFVGAFVLSSKWGLDQGFGTYSEPTNTYDPSLQSFAEIQRPATEVVNDAIAWLEIASNQPFFAWVHLYDPHLPYEPPPAFARQYPGQPYLGEVAYADAQLGRLQAHLESAGLVPNTLVVFAGDHGEGLGDHGELDHGLLLYQTTTRAPLIIAGPRISAAGTRRPEVVSLVDILPTIAEPLGLPLPETVHGRSLWPLLTGSGEFIEVPVLAETQYPFLHFGWSPLTAIQDPRFQYIHSSEPELYDLEDDPRQEVDLFSDRADIARRMQRTLEEMTVRFGQGALDAASTPDTDTIAKLEALGYVVQGEGPDTGRSLDDLPNPRNMLATYNQLLKTTGTIATGDHAAGERQLRAILETNDTIVDAWVALGRLYRRQGRLADAATAFRRAHLLRPLDPFLVTNLANSLIAVGRPADAEVVLRAALEEQPEDPSMVYALGRALEASGRFDESEALFRQSVQLDPNSAHAHVRLASIALQREDFVTAEVELDSALGIDPRAAEANLMRGQLLERRNRLAEAEQAYRAELGVAPNSLPAAIALSRLLGRLGRTAEQEQVLRHAIEANPRSPGPYLVLALTFLQRGERLNEAVELAELGLQQAPQGQELQMAYFLLANLHERLGNADRSADYARRAAQTTSPTSAN
jgi:arylsulfatase A-like enzyme/tetratricopeptide (TPR) repeat protein